jgi:hypothetical protein
MRMGEDISGSMEPDDQGEPIGIFPTWKALYATVLIYTAITIVVLYTFTVIFDRSVS